MSLTERDKRARLPLGDMRSGGFDMLRKIIMACIAAAAVATVAIPIDDAFARGRGGGHHGGFHRGGGFRVFGPGFGYYPYAYGVGCYRTVRVFTPYGPRLRRVWVC
jgi:hypothetical protein